MEKTKIARNKKKWIILGTTAAVLIAMVIIYVSISNRINKKEDADNAYKLEEVIIGDIDVTTQGNGIVKAKNEIPIEVVYDSTIKKLEKGNGDFVEKGEVIASTSSMGLGAYITDLETQLMQLSAQLTNSSVSAETYITSDVTGRVKRIDIEEEDIVKEVIKDHHELMEIAADGKLKVTFENVAPVQIGDKVIVSFDNYAENGVVEVIEQNLVTVTIEDSSYYNVDTTVSVTNKDGLLLGEGKLESNQPYYVTGEEGTISDIYVGLNEKVFAGTTLIALGDMAYSGKYKSYVDSRNQKLWELQKAKEYQEKLQITAPEDGIISGLKSVQGEKVMTGMVLCNILQVETYELVVPIDELDIDGVMPGQEAKVVFDAFEDELQSGKVTNVCALGTNTNGVTTYDVTVELKGDKKIKTNMSANATITLASDKEVLLVPVDALQTIEGEKYVTVVSEEGKNQTTQQAKVTVGLINSTYAQIKEGVNAGDKVQVIGKTDDSMDFFKMGAMNGVNKMSEHQDTKDSGQTVDPEKGGVK